MTTEATTEPGAGLPEGAFAGRETFRQLVRDALARAAEEGWRELILCDASFHDWPLGERACVEALHAWARGAGRRFTMLARRYDEVPRQHARFVEWRRQWSHRIECRACPSADPQDLPSALWSPGWVLQRLDPLRSGGVSGGEAERRQLLREQIDHWLGRSTPGFPATTLGL
ncbi:MAG: hypothetical protein QM772_01460 [Ottowia sp.]|uniref:hypothetical protein n=1 Tax=Ottowia sp. TaxID=1898956 RepID=UPI0039E3CEA1